MNDRAITGAMLVALMKPGQGYQARQLADKLGVSTADLRAVLANAVQSGDIEQTGARRTIKYWLPKVRAGMPGMKAYVPPKEMQQALERCKELRVHPTKY